MIHWTWLIAAVAFGACVDSIIFTYTCWKPLVKIVDEYKAIIARG